MTPTSFGLRVGSLSAGHTQAHLLIHPSINPSHQTSSFLIKIRGKLKKLPSSIRMCHQLKAEPKKEIG
jgi:hypothetical protein